MQSTQTTIMALLLAHLLGDFPLQVPWIATNKGKRITSLLCHGAIHYILAWACLHLFTTVSFFAFSNQFVIVLYIALHLLTDKLKHTIAFRKPSLDGWQVFLLDQAVHVTLLTIAGSLLTGASISQLVQGFQLSPNAKMHLLEAGIIYVAVMFGGGYLIRSLTRNYIKDDHSYTSSKLKNAGLYVGWLERFLIVTAIAIQSPTLVGLILTGKSIARFPEFKEARFAEYFLIGTLLSLSLSVTGGILLLQLWYGAVSLK